MKPVLEIQNVSKKFRINHLNVPYQNFRDRIMGMMTLKESSTEDFWALQDVSFSVQGGESIGIIGKNGAGKSTLLKILSKITPPTQGKIICRGRMASLLEVGTGFHPELTGRENVFLNGSILGMKRKEIAARFDEIIDFAGTEKFLDTPLKHYSSGMQLRLAFAVAAFLEPEILVIDEVLAVGDAEFQHKCLGKMEDVTRSGRTILFVSHNLGAVVKLCTKAIILREGKITFQGETQEAINLYSDYTLQQSSRTFDHPNIKSLRILQENEKLVLLVNYEVTDIKSLSLGFVISDQFGNKIFGTNPRLSDFKLPAVIEPKGVIRTEITDPKLRAGHYMISLWINNGFMDFFQAEDCLAFHIDNMIPLKVKSETVKVGPVIPETKWLYETI